MLLEKCPHCQTSHVQVTVRFADQLKQHSGALFWKIVRCQNPSCERLVLIVESERNAVLQIFPVGEYMLEASIPVSDEIRDDFKEAGLSLGAGCFKASMVMSRRVLQRILKEQGCTQRNLVDAIEYAIKQDILRKSFHEVAEEIRHYGNLGAHPDDEQLTNANKESAQQILDFTRLLIHDFYEVPAVAKKLKENRKNPSP